MGPTVEGGWKGEKVDYKWDRGIGGLMKLSYVTVDYMLLSKLTE